MSDEQDARPVVECLRGHGAMVAEPGLFAIQGVQAIMVGGGGGPPKRFFQEDSRIFVCSIYTCKICGLVLFQDEP